jgi:hypothetical protein
VGDEVRGELARKLQERELEGEQFDTGLENTESRTQSGATWVQNVSRKAAAGLWAVAIGVGVATDSVPAAIATMVGGFMAINLVAFGWRYFGSP